MIRNPHKMTLEEQMSYGPTTTIKIDPEGWRVTRRTTGDRFRAYGRYASLGDAAAMIRNAERACSSDWKVEGVAVDGRSTAVEVAARLRAAGKISE